MLVRGLDRPLAGRRLLGLECRRRVSRSPFSTSRRRTTPGSSSTILESSSCMRRGLCLVAGLRGWGRLRGTARGLGGRRLRRDLGLLRERGPGRRLTRDLGLLLDQGLELHRGLLRRRLRLRLLSSRSDGPRISRIRTDYFWGLGMVRRRPMRPWGPTTKGRERAFQFLSASGGSEAVGLRGLQFFPSSREMSVPLGPTVIQSFCWAS